MGIPLVRGAYPSTFGSGEGPVLISAALARRLFGDTDPIGQRIRRSGDATWDYVAGVVGDVPRVAIGGEPLQALYVPVVERAVDNEINPLHLTLVARTAGEPLALLPSVRAIVRGLDPALPIARVQTMERVVADSMARTTLAMIMLLLAGSAAFLLGMLGVYAVVAYAVDQRTRELGIRVALGARAADVHMLVLRQAGEFVGAGLLAGLAVVLAGARVLQSLLYGVAPLDVRTLASVMILVSVAALSACALPAHRAARVDPGKVLKG
jgi:putative ABC transport system permease protein